MPDSEYKPTILVIDDNKSFCKTITHLVSKLNYLCLTANTLKDGMALLNNENIDLVFLDVQLPDGNGLDYIDKIKNSQSLPEVIMLTGHGDPDGAELAIQKGVWDYLLKPSSVKNTQLSLNRALAYRKEKKNESPPIILKINNIVGSSTKLKECFKTVAQAAKSDSNVLVTGCTGTGKELFAKTIHDNSVRDKENFVIVDCAALTETLVESILFGHKKGSFTGAENDSIGLIKHADKGTLFLDEIGELPLSIQKTFLRVLQEKSFRRVGETGESKSDFRLIAATNKDLQKMVHQKTFREDLLFRLCTITLHLPPLTERLEDLEPLANNFIATLCEKYNLPKKSFDSDFFQTLSKFPWPGNIRQLNNVLERAFINSGDNGVIYTMDLPQEVRIEVARSNISQTGSTANTSPSGNLKKQYINDHIANLPVAKDYMSTALFNHSAIRFKDFKSSMEKQYLEELIRHTDRNVKDILSISGLSRSHFYALLKKNNISFNRNSTKAETN